MKLNWCHGCGGGNNFGDQLGPRLLRRYGFAVEWARPAEAELVTAGSVLSKFPPGWRGTVLGTGLIREGMRSDMRRARVLAVRGAYTRARTRGASEAILGDPGVLCADLFVGLCKPRAPYELVVGHYIDRGIAERHPGAEAADICGDPRALLADIANASLVYTSTLHGLIAADALGVPAVYEPHPGVIGGEFKFQDYASALGGHVEPGVPYLSDRGEMARVQAALRSAYGQLA